MTSTNDGCPAVKPAIIYLFKGNNGNTGLMCDICLKMTAKTLEQCQCHRPSIFIGNSEKSTFIALEG